MERARIAHDGTGTGWGDVLGGSLSTSAQPGTSVTIDPATGDLVVTTGAAERFRVSAGGVTTGLLALVLGWKKPEDFGYATAKSDADNTTAMQAWATYITTNGKTGYLLDHAYRVNDKINFSRQPGWAIIGANKVATKVVQATDNTPIFNLGSDTVSSMWGWRIDNITFDYDNSQPSTNTSAIPILFSGEGYQGALDNLIFEKGCYAIAVATGIGCPWGCSWGAGGGLQFKSGLTKGAINFNPGINAVPNNVFGRLNVDASNMVGPIFDLRGYNTTVDAIEVFNANQGAQILVGEAGFRAWIGALKLENGTYSTTIKLVDLISTSEVVIEHFFVGGSALTFSGATTKVTAIQTGAGGGGGSLKIDTLDLAVTTLSGGATAFAISAGVNQVEVRRVHNLSGGFALTDVASTTSADTLVVKGYVTGHLSGNKGDADYTAALGDPNIVSYETTLTAVRTVNLPSVNGNLVNGLYYTVRAYGAINGTNTILVKCNGATLATLATDKVAATFMYRRNAANPQGGWLMVGYQSLP